MMGWECPKCGQVYGPMVSQCLQCVAITKGTLTMCTCGTTIPCCLHPGNCFGSTFVPSYLTVGSF